MCYDLSTSGNSGTGFVVPTIRVGHLRFRILWSDALPRDIVMLMLCEFPSTLYLNKDGGSTKSFTPR
jgi:hypothetical protein